MAELNGRGRVRGHADLPHAAGVGAQVGSESYVEALARVVFYWAYPGVDAFGRTNMWQIMAGQRGSMLGVLPAAPENQTGGSARPAQSARPLRGS
jgi:hypothetical protein